MKSKIILSYLLSSFIPPIALVVSEWIQESEDCGQCKGLLLAGAFLILTRLLLVHAVQFLGLIRIKNQLLDLILVICYSFSSSLILLVYLLQELMTGNAHTDWEFIEIPAIINFLLGFFTFWVLMSIRKQKS
jgi:hypothetical protein